MVEQGQVSIEQTDNSITLSRLFDAPRELVFSMFKNPDNLAKWWGPKSWPATIVSFDFRPGGVWHYYMTGPDGKKEWGKATFQDIDEPNKLSFVDVFSDETGAANPELPQGIMTFTFQESDGETVLTAVGEYQSAAEVQQLLQMGMLQGMQETWDQLDQLLQAAQQ